MLRNRSRAVTTKQALMADQTSLPSPIKKPSSLISSSLISPRFFNGFLSKNPFADTEANAAMSPTSILGTKSNNPFGQDQSLSKQDTRAIGLALIDSIIQENGESRNFSKPVINRAALYGSKLNVQIPDMNPTPPISPDESPKSPAEFGIKTRCARVSNPFSTTPVNDFARQLSLREMEDSEDYTCVISHGPNPKTTHIFDDCIVGRCLEDHSEKSECRKMECGYGANESASPSSCFSRFCHTCKEVSGQRKDIYICRV